MTEDTRPPRRGSLLQGLPADELQRVQNCMHRVSFAPDAVLIDQGSRPAVLYLLISGVLSVDVEREPGKTIQVDRLVPGECAGELSLLTGLPASATVRALVPSECWALKHESFLALLTTCPTLSANVQQTLSRRLYERSLHDTRAGIKHLMRLRVRPGVPTALPEAIARSIARHRGAPLLVLDERESGAWRADEEAPAMADLIGQESVRERLSAGAAVLPVVSRIEQITVEGWTALEEWLPPEVSHALLITAETAEGQNRAPLFPAPIELEVRRDVTLVPFDDVPGPGTLPADTVDVALLGAPVADNTVHLLELACRRTGYRVVRECTAPACESDVNWLARHLAGMKVGLTLGSGGARGFAHIGLVDELLQIGIPVDYIGGCSIGACVGAGFATKLNADTIMHSLADFAHAAFRPTVPAHSLASNAGFVHVVQRLWGDMQIEDTPIPLAMVATDLHGGREVVMNHGLLWKAVTASASIPGIYPPIRSGDLHLVDGGVVDPLPVEVTRQLGADIVIAVKLGAPEWPRPQSVTVVGDEGEFHLPNILEVVHHAFDLMSTDLNVRQAAPGDVTIVVDVPSLSVREFVRGVEYMDRGRRLLHEHLPHIARVLPMAAQASSISAV